MSSRLVPPVLVAVAGLFPAVYGVVASQPAEVVVSITGITVTLAGCLAFALRQILSKTIPSLQKEHAETMTAQAAHHAKTVKDLVEAFERRAESDRRVMLDMHRALSESVGRMANGLGDVTKAVAATQEVMRRAVEIQARCALHVASEDHPRLPDERR